MTVAESDVKMFVKTVLSAISLLCICLSCFGQATTTTGSPSTTAQPGIECSEFSQKTCEECLRNVSCLWCNTDKVCTKYPAKKIFPPASLCALSEARWGVCWVNFQTLIISMSVIAGVILLALFVFCCCCCCRCRRDYRGRDPEEERLTREREERMQRAAERKAERKIKHDEIRRKYGLLQDSDHPYSRYENE